MKVSSVSRRFWSGKRVFITGHTGFKGAWLSLWLTDMGAHVYGYALPPSTSPSLFDLAGLAEHIAHHQFATTHDPAALADAVKRAKPDVVIHMAAQALVHQGYADPTGTYMTNVMGTVHLLEACRGQDSIAAILVVTSDKCYENCEWHWGYRETDRLGGRDPYSSSKACAELVTDAYRRSFYATDSRPLVASARAGNVIGGGDWAADRLVPDIMRAYMAGRAPLIRSPNATRPWQHVLEPLSGYLLLCEALCAQNGNIAAGWNFGPAPDDAKPVAWIADRLASLWQGNATWTRDGDQYPHEATYLYLDTSKARSELGYRPRWALSTALERIVEWYKGFIAGAELRQLTLEQIRAFERTEPAE